MWRLNRLKLFLVPLMPLEGYDLLFPFGIRWLMLLIIVENVNQNWNNFFSTYSFMAVAWYLWVWEVSVEAIMTQSSNWVCWNHFLHNIKLRKGGWNYVRQIAGWLIIISNISHLIPKGNSKSHPSRSIKGTRNNFRWFNRHMDS